jgi:hypothetical protein
MNLLDSFGSSMPMKAKNDTQMTRTPTQWFPVARTKRLPIGGTF